MLKDINILDSKKFIKYLVKKLYVQTFRYSTIYKAVTHFLRSFYISWEYFTKGINDVGKWSFNEMIPKIINFLLNLI